MGYEIKYPWGGYILSKHSTEPEVIESAMKLAEQTPGMRFTIYSVNKDRSRSKVATVIYDPRAGGIEVQHRVETF